MFAFQYACLALALVCTGALAKNLDEEVQLNQPLFVTIKPSDEFGTQPFKLTVEPSDTVSDLKRMISLHENSKVSAEQQQLFLNGHNSLDNNKRTLASYSVKHGDEIAVKKVSSTYFGVDASNHEAVRERQRELAHEQFKQLFGDDINPEDIHFNEKPNDSQKSGPNVATKIKETMKRLFERLLGKEKADESSKQSSN